MGKREILSRAEFDRRLAFVGIGYDGLDIENTAATIEALAEALGKLRDCDTQDGQEDVIDAELQALRDAGWL
jgi:hypothetical protein